MRLLLQMGVVSALACTIYANLGTIGDSTNIIRQVEVVTTSTIEIKNIGRAILMSYIQDGIVPKEKNFPSFLKGAMITHQDDVDRDKTRDIWGTEYKLKLNRRGAEITSAGPDKLFGTDDDIRHFQSLREYGWMGP